MAVQFTANSYAETLTAVATTRPLTMAGWFHADAGAATTGYIAAICDATGNNLFGLVARSGDEKVSAVERRQASWNQSSLLSYSAGSWHHACALFYGSTTRQVYLDGVAGTATSAGSPPLNLDRTLLRIRQGLPDPDSGLRLAEVAIWNAQLSADEIGWLAAGVSPLALGHHLSKLALYHPLYRAANESLVSPVLTTVGSAMAYPHPRTIAAQSPTQMAIARSPIAGPYRRDVSGLFLPGAVVGATFVAGSLTATAHSYTEGD